MAVVVQQTLPFSSTHLDLDNVGRWSRLFLLIRPSVVEASKKNGLSIMVDEAVASSHIVQIAVILSSARLPSKLLTGGCVASFTLSNGGNATVTTGEVVGALEHAGASPTKGLVVLRTGPKRSSTVATSTVKGVIVVELDVQDQLELDHVLSLLCSTVENVKVSVDKTTELLELFLNSATTTSSVFHDQKSGSSLAIKHHDGPASFESAHLSVCRDLASVSAPPNSSDVYSIHYADINGLSRLESYILAHEISSCLEERNIARHITSSAILDPSRPGRGWAISRCCLPRGFLTPQEKPANALNTKDGSGTTQIKPRGTQPHIAFTDEEIRPRLVNACKTIIREEPTITEYDTIVGDGDCGYTLRDGAKQVLDFVAAADLAALSQTLSALVDDLEVSMGGTSGALYCIFLSALAQSLWDAPSLPESMANALAHLLQFTSARLGDRTMLDCLIPFVETWKAGGDVNDALQAARKGVEGTKTMDAKLGRSTYLDEAATRGVPDPGAYGLLKLLEGLALL